MQLTRAEFEKQREAKRLELPELMALLFKPVADTALIFCLVQLATLKGAVNNFSLFIYVMENLVDNLSSNNSLSLIHI